MLYATSDRVTVPPHGVTIQHSCEFDLDLFKVGLYTKAPQNLHEHVYIISSIPEEYDACTEVFLLEALRLYPALRRRRFYEDVGRRI